MTIKINNTDLRIRPSAIDGFYQCSYQWGKTFLEGVVTIPNARAAIGTSIHKAAEVLWNDAITSGNKDGNVSKLTDAAIAEWKEQTHDGVQFDNGENAGTAMAEIIQGTEAFIEDIVPFTPIPIAVEQFYKVDIAHPLVSEIGGTIDYITNNTIADLKTSKRKPSPANYTTQQSTYRYLAEANGHDIKHNLIQGVVLKKQPEGMILPLEPKVEQAKSMINGMLDVLDVIAKDVVPIETLLRPNPKYYLCSSKYCSLYGKCPATSDQTKVQVTL